MKKITILLLFVYSGLYAQQNKPVDVTSKGVQIGQQVPNITITNIHNYKIKTAQISDFKGKLLILDFCATWCGACLSMVPRMDSLQKKFADKLQFLSVTYQSEKDVLPFYQKFDRQHNIKSVIPIVFGDIELTKLFPHKTLPHYVWINGEGRLVALTGLDEINERNIFALINSGSLNLARKKDLQVDYDYSVPLFLSKDLDGIVRTQSVLTGYMDGYGAVSAHNIHVVKTNVIRKITATNMSMIRLYQIALGKGTRKYSWAKTIVEVKDSSKLVNRTSGDTYRKWLNNGSGFCYELIVSDNMKDPFQIMEQDLNRYFTNYKVSIQKRTKDVLVLKRTTDIDRIKSKGGAPQTKINATGSIISNKPLSVLNSYIDTYIQRVADETGYRNNVDIILLADMDNIESINRELSKYGLIYSLEPREIEFLVINDRTL
ncbi:MAG: TlpA family protein disulfide reductase [Chryseobacterium sp.]|nr:MAG: TlpA family protein disulfide reductase [Chryseobacterium sp.]